MCKAILYQLLRVLVVILAFFFWGEVVWTVMLLTVVPLFACLYLLCVSFKEGCSNLAQDYSCTQIVIGNIFLLIYCAMCAFGKCIRGYFRSEIWDCIWNKRMLFPVTSRLL